MVTDFWNIFDACSAKNPLIGISLGVDIHRRDNMNCLSFVVSTVYKTALEVGGCLSLNTAEVRRLFGCGVSDECHPVLLSFSGLIFAIGVPCISTQSSTSTAPAPAAAFVYAFASV